MSILRITCPACKQSLTTSERSRHKAGFFFSTMICPHCGTELRPNLAGRVTIYVACALAIVVLVVHAFVSQSFNPDYVLLGLSPVAVAVIWMTTRGRWEVVPGSAPKTPPAPTKRAARIGGIDAIEQPAADNYAYKYSTPATTATDKYATVILCALMAGLFYFLLTRQLVDSPLIEMFFVFMCLSAGIALWAAFFFPKQQHVEMDGVCIRSRQGERTKTIAWQDIRQVRDPGVLNGVVIASRSGERMFISKSLEGFAQFREDLVDHLSMFYGQRTAMGRRFWCIPYVSVFLIVCPLALIGMGITLIYYKNFDLRTLAVIPVMIGLFVAGCRGMVYAQALPQGLKIRRLLWKTRIVPYSFIRDVSMNENVFPFLESPSPGRGNPGVMVTLRDDKTIAVAPLWGGPMEFYWQLRKAAWGN